MQPFKLHVLVHKSLQKAETMQTEMIKTTVEISSSKSTLVHLYVPFDVFDSFILQKIEFWVDYHLKF